ncbi:MAG: TetR/AcrR family transcriptional regulator [Tissierella sp.]|uniref:TetR/AcrR family transcriptional regulator n=1 Tax=Tissierella sp. TaxID=41274 RepID=UPI003F966B29
MKRLKKKVRMSKEERRAQIIDSAMKLFVENGYNATTTASIAEKADISEVTLFRHFSTKEELFKEGIEPILTLSLDDSIIKSNSMKATEKLKYILKDRIKFASNNRAILKLILMENQINSEVIGFDYVNNTVSLLEASIEEAGIKLKNKELSLRLLMGSILSFLYFPETDKKKIEEYIDNLVLTIK